MKFITLPSQRKYERGQILVIMALVFIGLVAVIGLAVDLGYMYVSYARLRRAVDAAALSATVQYKKNVSPLLLQKAAREFLVLNGVPDSNSLAANVDLCATTKADLVRFSDGNGDPELCTNPPRKLVRVTAREDVPMFFMAIVGISSVPIEVTSMAEAATLDVVLVIDRSESMGVMKADLTNYWPQGAQQRNPSQCNENHPLTSPEDTSVYPLILWTGDCHPFHEVKAAAVSFVNEFMDPDYDRVAIVVFDNVARPVDFNYGTGLAPEYFSGDRDKILAALRGLWMYDGYYSSSGGGDLRQPDQYFDGAGNPQEGAVCPFTYPDKPLPNVSFPTCRLLDSNSGFYSIPCPGLYNKALYGTPDDASGCLSTNMGAGLWWAANIFQQHGAREESLLVTILLTDGVPNAGYDKDNKAICPAGTRDRQIYCLDNDPLTRHYFATDPSHYDADDFTRDWADVLADPNYVGSLIFAIGLGTEVTSTKWSTPAEGATLLNYIADKGGTGTYYQASPQDLQKIFLAIARKIATRLNR